MRNKVVVLILFDSKTSIKVYYSNNMAYGGNRDQ